VLPHDKQQRMLESEGVAFDGQGCCRLESYLWLPEAADSRRNKAAQTTLFKRRSDATKAERPIPRNSTKRKKR
jgi:hypothetical protein